MNSKKKILVVSITSLALSVGSILGPFGSGEPYTLAATATEQTDDYANESIVNYFEKTMNEQLIAALSGSDGIKAVIEPADESSDEGEGASQYKSQISFKFDRKIIGDMMSKELINYVSEAIYSNPNLCMLSTDIRVYSSGTLEVQSVVEPDKYAEAIRRYKGFLADIERLPKQSKSMTDKEILLYLHDRVVQWGNYNVIANDRFIYIPLAMADSGQVVCQSYAAVMNHLMRDMGFVSYVLSSSDHAWNVVKLDGKWSYIDATWDDPQKKARDFVMHNYLLVDGTAFDHSHDISEYEKTRFSGITDNLFNFGLLPKTESIFSTFVYDGESWYYVKDGRVMNWDGVSSSSKVVDAIPQNSSRCVGELNGDIYVGGTDGLYKYKSGKLVTVDAGLSVEGMLYCKNGSWRGLWYKSGNEWTCFKPIEESETTYEDLNGTENLEVIELPVPTSPDFVMKKSSKKSIRISVTQLSDNAIGYQFQVATSKNFRQDKIKKNTKKKAATISGLTSGKTYYVRVRGIWKSTSTIYKKLGEWSEVKTIKL